MKKGRTTLNFTVSNPSAAKTLIESFISANHFELDKSGEFYVQKNPLAGNRYFTYQLSGSQLQIQGWILNIITKREFALDQGSLSGANLAISSYRDLFNLLIQEIEKLNQGGSTMDNNQNNPNQPASSTPIQTAAPTSTAPTPTTQPAVTPTDSQSFQAVTEKRNATVCEVAFWISLFGLIISFFGIVFGVVVYILDITFAIRGLKTKKRGKAIATLVMSALSIVIIVIKLIIALNE